MTYNAFGGTLNVAQLNSLHERDVHLSVRLSVTLVIVIT